MYICICKAVSDSDIDEAVMRGEVSTLDCLSSRFGVATGCGCCRESAQECLDDAVERCNGARRGASGADRTITR